MFERKRCWAISHLVHTAMERLHNENAFFSGDFLMQANALERTMAGVALFTVVLQSAGQITAKNLTAIISLLLCIAGNWSNRL